MTIIFLFVSVCSSILDDSEYNYICDTNGCNTPTNNYNNDISSIKFCSSEDVFTDVNFSIIENKNETSKFPAVVQINLKPPKNACKYILTLLANESINKEKCRNYKFHNSNGSEQHTKSTICFVSNDKQYQNTTGIFIPYIFTACYSIQFYFGDIKMIKDNKFLKTNYKRTEIIEPKVECTYEYNIVPDIENNKLVYFKIYFSVPMVIAGMIKLGTVANSHGSETCFINNEDFSYGTWNFDILNNYLDGEHHNLNTTLLTNDIYKNDIKFEAESLQEVNYCISISFYDTRCIRRTLWKPLHDCIWYQSCQNITPYNFAIPANTNPDTVSYLYLPIIIITLTIFAITGIIYLIYLICICNVQGKNFYINIFNGNIIETNEVKYKKSNIHTLKDITKKVNINTDIILLYPKGPESFMALMADFRGILSRVCQCVVHDWYDGIEWNYVAEIGAFDWFAEMLHKECRVVWIDTPIMRSLIRQKFNKNDFLKNSEQYSFIKIGDFRDVVFPTVFSLSKRNIEQSSLYQPKHFIVRLKGFENFENDNDPFVHLSSYMRYFIPQDLNLLCSHLSTLDSNAIVPFTNQEENLIKQNLHYVKSEFYK
ncbi:PREDICTED: uncharacterized protein LOC108552494 [Eufriesea mexicana]|uniref:uncharacterized protein LOC108552494 n=1 Tax=Eufriesea mexicana TaxID=516756 RepID=UPI00083BB92F|nr:PREDICTED: uncharacterized protein LOC108552494 [Eufriesea mexicana]